MKLLPYCPTTNVGTARVVVVELFSRGCVIVSETKGRARKEIRTFGTMTDDRLALADWLATEGVTPCGHGEHWRVLEGAVQPLRQRLDLALGNHAHQGLQVRLFGRELEPIRSVA